MGKYTSYYLYQKYEKIGSQDWTPVYPQTLSVYSDGTESGSTVIKSDNDTSCGYKPSTEVKYRWVKLNPSTDYICDNCELWVASGYICDNGDLYEQLNEQNFDGKNWYYTGVKKKGKLLEKNSKNCSTGDTGSTTGSTTGETTGSMKVTYTDGTTKYFTGLTSIEKDTDTNKKNAKEVEIYDIVKSIGYDAFNGCVYLTGITIPDSVTEIGGWAFTVCASLTSITIPNSVISIGNAAFMSCSSLTGITIPNSVTSIGEGAFEACNKLADIVISNSVTSINASTFYSCSSLTSITIPDSVTSIGNYAFGSCSKFTDITIPDKVTSIGEHAFQDNGKLATVTIQNSTSKVAYHIGAFDGIASNAKLYVPSNLLSDYQADSDWTGAFKGGIFAIP